MGQMFVAYSEYLNFNQLICNIFNFKTKKGINFDLIWQKSFKYSYFTAFKRNELPITKILVLRKKVNKRSFKNV